jgi:hypothetical protein
LIAGNDPLGAVTSAAQVQEDGEAARDIEGTGLDALRLAAAV